MIRVGLKSLVMAELTKDNDANMSENGQAEVAYGKIKSMPNVQSLELNATVQETNVDSDDTTDVLSVCSGYNGTVTRDAFSPEDLAWLLGEKKVDGINVSTGADEAPYVAFGFKTLLKGKGSGGQYLYMWVLKAKFSQSNFSAQSMGNETLTPQADAISFKSSSRYCDGAWRFYTRSNSGSMDSTFFSQNTLQKLATAAEQVYSQPVNGVIFAENLPDSGTVGNVYIVSDKAYYWNGTEFAEVE
nr:MAG TPA: major tail protein [Caudoviricetes sp.]